MAIFDRLFRRRRPPGAGQGQVVAQIKDLAHDLMSLEINTIIKDSMTGERMPGPPGALLDIVGDYAKLFERLGVDLAPFLAVPPDPQTRLPADAALRQVPLLLAGRPGYQPYRLPDAEIVFGQLFTCLRWAAKNSRHALALTARDRLLLDRIENNCDSLRTILEDYPPLYLEPLDPRAIRAGRETRLEGVALEARHLLAIRKIWEIGTEEIVAQTVIQLDGDVVTRITPDLAAQGEQAKPVLAIHQNGIETGITSWRHLAETVQSVVRAMLVGPSGPPSGGA